MKKLLISAVLLLVSITSYAQFEQNKWVITPSLTQFNLSYSGHEKTTFGFEAEGGLFLIDNLAVMLNCGAVVREGDEDKSFIGIGGRYYLDDLGIYIGAKARFDQYDYIVGNKKDLSLGGEVGYAFFLSRHLTVEPAVYYNQSLTDQKYSKIGVKIGFGFYF